jgi:hypothetical protein
VSIDFEKFETDRRVSRPPGAPASWTSPIVGSSKSPRSKPSSPALNASRPISYSPRIPELQELRPSNTHLRSTTEQPPVRPFSEHLSPLLNARHSEDVHRPVANTRPASRVILGSYPAPSSRPPQPQSSHRESKVMTIEELDSRHKSAMRKLQQPMTEKVSAVAKPSSASPKTILHSRSAASLAHPPTHAKEPRDHARNSSFVPATHAATRPLGRLEDVSPSFLVLSFDNPIQSHLVFVLFFSRVDCVKASAPAFSPTPAASSRIPSAHPPKSTNAWLSY